MTALARHALLGAAAAILAAATSSAQTMMGLTEGQSLVEINAKTWAATRTMKISGVAGRLVGIDVRPSNGMLYGLGQDGTLYVIALDSGAATSVAKLNKPMTAVSRAVVDFNPVADRLRVILADGTNLRINVDTGDTTTDGTLKFDPAGAMKDAKPAVTAGAYTNSVAGTKQTALYDIDLAQGALLLQSPPNDGVLKTVGKLGIAAANVAAFEIVAGADGSNVGWLVAGRTVYSVDLATGAATQKGAVKGVNGNLIDIAALPAR